MKIKITRQNTVDLALLKRQKAVFERLVSKNARTGKITALDGILNLLDFIQNGLENHGRVTLNKKQK